jgi:catechol 2,3-dioxygenase-like lactoylglutathione lyase family enzyme
LGTKRRAEVATRLHQIIIPVKNIEEMNRARDFFVNVLGLEVQRETATLGKIPKPKMTEADRRFPDHFCHMVDKAGLIIDLVVYDDGDVSYGKGVAIGFEVDDIQATWDAAPKGYPVRPIFDPISYGESILPIVGHKEAYFAFLGLKMGRISNDGEEQILQIMERRKRS